MYKSENGTTATLFVKRTSNTSDDYYCTDNNTTHNINLYLSNSKSIINIHMLFTCKLKFLYFTDTLPIPAITLSREEQETITFTVSGGSGKYVTRYDCLDLGVPVEVGHRQ